MQARAAPYEQTIAKKQPVRRKKPHANDIVNSLKEKCKFKCRNRNGKIRKRNRESGNELREIFPNVGRVMRRIRDRRIRASASHSLLIIYYVCVNNNG